MAGLKEAILKLKVELDEESKRVVETIQKALKDLEAKMMKPTLGRIVWYRGKRGYLAMRSAIVTCTTNELIQDSVEAGNIAELDSDMHVHLNVFTPSAMGSFPEFNIPFGRPGEDGLIPPGTWCWPKIIQ